MIGLKWKNSGEVSRESKQEHNRVRCSVGNLLSSGVVLSHNSKGMSSTKEPSSWKLKSTWLKMCVGSFKVAVSAWVYYKVRNYVCRVCLLLGFFSTEIMSQCCDSCNINHRSCAGVEVGLVNHFFYTWWQSCLFRLLIFCQLLCFSFSTAMEIWAAKLQR